MLVTLLMLAAILYLAYRVSKYVGTVAVRQSQSRYIKIADMMSLGQDKAIAVTQVGGRIFLVGITSGGMTNIAELSPEDLTELELQTLEMSDMKEKFADIIKKVKNRKERQRGDESPLFQRAEKVCLTPFRAVTAISVTLRQPLYFSDVSI